MGPRVLNILLVGQRYEDRVRVARALKRSGLESDVSFTRGLAGIAAAAEQTRPGAVVTTSCGSVDAIISALRDIGSDAPLILIVTSANEKKALAALEHGASDYVLRDGLAGLAYVIRRAVALVEKGRGRRERPGVDETPDTHQAAVLAAFNEVYFRTRMDGTIERISPSVAYRSGYSSEELIGQNVHDLYAIPEQRQRFLAELTARGSVEDFHITLCSKQGVLVDVSINAALVTDAEGRPVAIDGSLRDITERKRIEVELRRSELRYRTLAENFPNGSVFLFDRDLRFTLAEGEGLRVSGPRKEEIEGKTLREVFGTELCEILEPAYRAALQGKSSVLEAGYADQIYSVHVLPVKDENDVVHSGMVVTQDITERKRVEAEREDLVRKLQEALASIRTLRGLVPICSSCRKIRNDSGYWQQVEDYVREHSDVRFSHGLCGDCARRLYPDLFASAGKNSKAS